MLPTVSEYFDKHNMGLDDWFPRLKEVMPDYRNYEADSLIFLPIQDYNIKLYNKRKGVFSIYEMTTHDEYNNDIKVVAYTPDHAPPYERRPDELLLLLTN